MYDSVQAILAQIKSRGPKEAPCYILSVLYSAVCPPFHYNNRVIMIATMGNQAYMQRFKSIFFPDSAAVPATGNNKAVRLYNPADLFFMLSPVAVLRCLHINGMSHFSIAFALIVTGFAKSIWMLSLGMFDFTSPLTSTASLYISPEAGT